MNKSLEALERLKNTLLAEGYWQDILQDVSIIETELKALEIIKKYNVRPSDYHYNTTYDIYLCNMSFVPDDEIMSEEEYNLLKEVLQ